MDKLIFVKFNSGHYNLYAEWSKDDEINRWLGDATHEWLDYVLSTTSSFIWMIYEHDVPVANLQIDLAEDDPSQAQVTIMIAPQLRRQGYGRCILTDMLGRPELKNVTRFYAFVKPDNTASVGLLKAMGYGLVSPEISDTGYVEYAFVRS